MKFVWWGEYFPFKRWAASWCWVFRKKILFCSYIKEFWTHVLYMWLAKAWCMVGEDGCVERSEATIRTNLVNRWFSFSGKFYIFLGKVTGSVNFKKFWLWQPWLTLVSCLNGRPVLPELCFYFKTKYFQKLFRAGLINGYSNIAHYYVAYFTYIFLFDDITIELSKRQSRWYSV